MEANTIAPARGQGFSTSTPVISLCTLTGVDERTDLALLSYLSDFYRSGVQAFAGSEIEWGFLYSPKRMGQPGRYPSMDFLKSSLMGLDPKVRVALHICGAGVMEALDPYSPANRLIEMVAVRKGRVQLNFSNKRSSVDLEQLASTMRLYPEVMFITQENAANAGVREGLAQYKLRNHAVLFDSSGGRGILAKEWPRSVEVPCGYAGGLGPDTLVAELPRILGAAAGKPTWVDMEGSLRVPCSEGNDWFDLSVCQQVIEKLKYFEI